MIRRRGYAIVHATVLAIACAVVAAESPQRSFATPEDAVAALGGVVQKGDLSELVAIFGPDGQSLIDSSDPATARRSREVFAAAFAETWRLVDAGPDRKVLVIGNEDWPFPVPLAKEGSSWRFDTAAGKEEVIARRIGQNELAAIQICHTYVAAQRVYASRGHDGRPEGSYAQRFRSDLGRQNGLYWAAARGEKRSPLGDLMPSAEQARQAEGPPTPFHGYFFKILTAQGAAAAGGAKNYVVNGAMSGGFALVAWPAQYDVTGVMTFIVNQEDRVFERDLGPETATLARKINTYNPDASWAPVP